MCRLLGDRYMVIVRLDELGKLDIGGAGCYSASKHTYHLMSVKWAEDKLIPPCVYFRCYHEKL